MSVCVFVFVWHYRLALRVQTVKPSPSQPKTDRSQDERSSVYSINLIALQLYLVRMYLPPHIYPQSQSNTLTLSGRRRRRDVQPKQAAHVQGVVP